MGHAQAAAGVAGMIKMVMAMGGGVLRKTLHVDQPSSHVDWEAGEIELLTEAVPWEPNGGPRRAGVSAFGVSGTNAHVILEEASTSPVEAGDEAGSSDRAPLKGPVPLPLSAKTEPALREAAARLHTHVEDNPDLDPADVAYSLATARAAFEHRAVVLGADREELLSSLASFANGTPSPNVLAATAQTGKLAFLFSGQGSQRPAMGRELYEADPAYAEAFDRACEQLDPELGEPLAEIVFGGGEGAAERLQGTAYAQPALFVTELALCRALASRGLKPDLLAGHSIGEITAAHLAGVLSLPDAAKLVVARGALMGALPAGGAMLAVAIGESEARESIQGKEGEIAIAAINSPTSLVLSGAEEAIEAAAAAWEGRGKQAKRPPVSHAFHSPLI